VGSIIEFRSVLVETRFIGWLDQCNLGQGAVGQIGEVFRDRRDAVWIFGENGLLVGEILEVGQGREAAWLVGRAGAGAVFRVDVDLPRDSGVLQSFEYGLGGDARSVFGVGAIGIHIAVRGGGVEIFMVGVAARHLGVEPAVGGGEVGRHEVVVVEVAAVVVSHGADAVGVKKRRLVGACIVGRGPDEAIHLCRIVAHRVGVVPVDVGLVPGRAGVLCADGIEMEGCRRVGGVIGAVAGRRKAGVAAGVAGGRCVEGRDAGGGVELRQAIERLIGIAAFRPVFPQCAHVIIKGPILLHHKHDVIEQGEIGGSVVECGSDKLGRRQRNGAGCAPGARARPARKCGAGSGRSGELDGCSLGKLGATGRWTVDAGWGADHRTRAGACLLNGELHLREIECGSNRCGRFQSDRTRPGARARSRPFGERGARFCRGGELDGGASGHVCAAC
jgi:hypothetical protein